MFAKGEPETFPATWSALGKERFPAVQRVSTQQGLLRPHHQVALRRGETRFAELRFRLGAVSSSALQELFLSMKLNISQRRERWGGEMAEAGRL